MANNERTPDPERFVEDKLETLEFWKGRCVENHRMLTELGVENESVLSDLIVAQKLSHSYQNVARQAVDLLCDLLEKDVTLEESENIGNILIGKFNRLRRSTAETVQTPPPSPSEPLVADVAQALLVLRCIADQVIPTPKHYDDDRTILHERDAMVHMAKDVLAKIKIRIPPLTMELDHG